LSLDFLPKKLLYLCSLGTLGQQKVATRLQLRLWHSTEAIETIIRQKVLYKKDKNYPLEKVKFLPEDFFIHPDHKVVFHQGDLWFTLLSPRLT
jgi:hypothetical protein